MMNTLQPVKLSTLVQKQNISCRWCKGNLGPGRIAICVSYIWKTKDQMHCADHAVKDTLSKITSFHKNRTEKYAVREACQEHGFFLFFILKINH